MASKKEDEKTNVMRLLDAKKVSYHPFCYIETGAVNGMEVAAVLGQNPDQVFKTLVTQGKSKDYYVFVIPVNQELDLKKAATAVGEKKIEMLKAKDLLGLTGYIHGGCSPIGMKKNFVTVLHQSADEFDSIFFSAGKVGYQVQVAVKDISKLLRCTMADIIVRQEN